MPPATAPEPESGSPSPRPLTVELRAARIPVIGWLAWHHWFVIDRGGRRDRWEVWQTAGAGGASWGHLHCNLLPPDRGVGAGPSWVLGTWTEAAAVALAERIENSPTKYPWCERYRYWPGPNSNTYAGWVLDGRHPLDRHAVGCRYRKA